MFRGLSRPLVGVALILGLAAPWAAAQDDPFLEATRVVAEHVDSGRLEEAVELLLEAESGLDPDELRRAWVRHRIAEIRRLQGRYSAALEELVATEQAIESSSAREEWKQRMRVSADAQRARVLLDWGLLDEARDELGNARRRLEELRGAGIAIELEDLTLNYLEVSILAGQQDWDGMRECVDRYLYQEQEELYERHPRERAQLLAKAGVALYEVTRLDPDSESACREFLELALDFPELPVIDRCAPRLALVQLAHRARNWKEVEAGLAAAAEDLGSPEERRSVPYYYATWAALAARFAMERTDEKVGRADLEAHRDDLALAIEEELARWGRRELRPGGYGFLSYNPSQLLLSEWIRLTLFLGEDRERAVEEALETVFEAHSHGTLVRRMGGAASDLETFRSLWIGSDPAHVVLVYLPAADRSHLFVLGEDSLEHHELAAVDPLEKVRRALERSIQEPLREDAPEWKRDRREEALGEMSRALLPDELVPRLSATERLTIVGLDLLGEVPFENLSAGELGSLGSRFAITYLPSLAMALALAARHEAAPSTESARGSVLLVGSPDPDRPLVEEHSFRAMVTDYGDRARVLREGEATFAGLCANAAGAQVLQLFTHGRLDRDRERPATFELAVKSGTSYFGADEIEAQLDAPEVVLLTVCGTARGPLRRGDASAAELAGAFFMAGNRTRCVIASAFDLEANAAARLARGFHRGLLAGETPAEALRRAREELAGDERYADPFYHGLMRVIGLGHRPVFQP